MWIVFKPQNSKYYFCSPRIWHLCFSSRLQSLLWNNDMDRWKIVSIKLAPHNLANKKHRLHAIRESSHYKKTTTQVDWHWLPVIWFDRAIHNYSLVLGSYIKRSCHASCYNNVATRWIMLPLFVSVSSGKKFGDLISFQKIIHK